MRAAIVIVVLGIAATTAYAQPRLKGPEASPQASIHQTVGITEISVSYHRPAVGGREVWGKLVPYGEVWRAGANENTTVTFSTDVKIAGKPLRAGTYALHMLPTAKSFTVIFNTFTGAWGSFAYDQKEDALRVIVTPRTLATPEERMAFHFDDPSMTKTTLTLAWEKLAVPIAIEVETPKLVMASMRRELRGQPGFAWQAWNQAATYWLGNGGNLDEALKMADRSIEMNASYANLMTRAAILEKKGNVAGAKDARAKAQPLASEADLNLAGYALVNEKKLDEAIALFQSIVQRFPASWNAQDSLGEALAVKGDKAAAVAAYQKALAMAKDPVQRKRIQATIARLKK
jgi:predicted Zn-dependent protease